MSRIRANQITNQSADGAPTVQHGLIIAGVSTFTGSVSIGGTLTYEDVTNIDSVGVVTARTGVVTPNVDVDDFISVGSNIHLGNAGVVTATSYRGDGSQLTGITGTTINNNANNRLITGSGTANTLEGEANLQWDGETLYINRSSNSVEGLSISNSNNSQGSAAAQLNLSGGDNSYSNIRLECNSTSHHIRQDGSGNLKFYNDTNERLRIESWGGIHNNQDAIYGSGASNEPVIHFNGAVPSADAARGQFAFSDSAAYNASPIARISLVTRYNSAGGYTFMGGIEGGKENTTDGNYDGFVRIVTRKHGASNIERLRIHSTGQVTKPASCAFNVTHSGNQNYSSAGSHTITNWKTTDSFRGFENTTTGGYFSGGIFTAPVTGAYFFTSTILLSAMNGTYDVHMIWSKNNAYYSYWETRFNETPTGYQNYEAVSGQCTMPMSAGDTCRIKISFTGSGCGVYGADQNWGNWGGFLIG